MSVKYPAGTYGSKVARENRVLMQRDRRIAFLKHRVLVAARKSAAAITKAHRGDESNIADENVLVAAVAALDKAEQKGQQSLV